MRKKSLLIIALVVALEASAYGWNNFGHETMLALPYFARKPFASAQDVAEALGVPVAVAATLVAESGGLEGAKQRAAGLLVVPYVAA